MKKKVKRKVAPRNDLLATLFHRVNLPSPVWVWPTFKTHGNRVPK